MTDLAQGQGDGAVNQSKAQQFNVFTPPPQKKKKTLKIKETFT